MQPPGAAGACGVCLWAASYAESTAGTHRLVYEAFKAERTVRVLRMWTHYE